jgi:AcrR family transcriptional regulator
MERKTMPSRPRTKPVEIRREELMDAAERLFVEKGIAATSVDDIVAAASVAKGTFYYYFESKDHMLAALQERFIGAMAQQFQTAMDRHRPDDWMGRLHAWISTGIDSYLDRIALHDVVFHEHSLRNRSLKHENVNVANLTDFLREGVRADVWKIDDPRLTAIVLFNALHAAVDDVIVQGGKANRKRLVLAMEKIFDRIVAAA